MQTAEHPQDRLQLAQVAAEASIAEMYSIVATEDTAEVAAAAAGRAQLRRAFLVRAEGAQRAHVTAVSEDLCRIEQDFKQVRAADTCLPNPSVKVMQPMHNYPMMLKHGSPAFLYLALSKCTQSILFCCMCSCL